MDADRAKTSRSVFIPSVFMLPDIFFHFCFPCFLSPLKYLNEISQKKSEKTVVLIGNVWRC